MINNKEVISVQAGKLIVLPQRIPDRFTEDFTTTCTLEVYYSGFPPVTWEGEFPFAQKTFNVEFSFQ